MPQAAAPGSRNVTESCREHESYKGLRDVENANIPFLDGTGGRIASLLRVYVALPHGTCNA